MYILVTGGFDPIHSGHLQLFEQASKIGSLVVAANSDAWLTEKKGSFLLPRAERVKILDSIKFVTYTIGQEWDDSDGSSIEAIELFYKKYAGTKLPLAFANGGDRVSNVANSKEILLCRQLGIVEIFNLGGVKTVSSSKFLKDYVDRITNNT